MTISHAGAGVLNQGRSGERRERYHCASQAAYVGPVSQISNHSNAVAVVVVVVVVDVFKSPSAFMHNK